MHSEHYKPLHRAGTHYNLKLIEGTIPPEADGLFFNIGQNPKYTSNIAGSNDYNLGDLVIKIGCDRNFIVV